VRECGVHDQNYEKRHKLRKLQAIACKRRRKSDLFQQEVPNSNILLQILAEVKLILYITKP
jgi:hypothetical protein